MMALYSTEEADIFGYDAHTIFRSRTKPDLILWHWALWLNVSILLKGSQRCDGQTMWVKHTINLTLIVISIRRTWKEPVGGSQRRCLVETMTGRWERQRSFSRYFVNTLLIGDLLYYVPFATAWFLKVLSFHAKTEATCLSVYLVYLRIAEAFSWYALL